MEKRFKQIRMTFTLEEHKKLAKLKEKLDYTWEQLMLSLLKGGGK